MTTIRKQSFLVSVKSREQLIQETETAIQNIQKRRTKIMATLGENTLNYENVKEFITQGANCLNLNAAYHSNKNALKEIACIREKLEKELDIYIPLNLILKGRQVRSGKLKQAEFTLKPGNIIRLISDNKVIGDTNILSIDDENFFDSVKIGDKVVLDYGQVLLQVHQKEDSEQAYKYLIEKYPDLYNNVGSFRKFDDTNETLSEDTFSRHESKKDSVHSITEQSDDPKNQEILKRKEKYAQALLREKEQKKLKKYKVLVCIIEAECLLKPMRPVFLMQHQKRVLGKFNQSCQSLSALQGRIQEQNEEEQDSSDEGEESQITAEDIVFINEARRQGFDTITISNVHKASEVRDLRNIMGEDNPMRIMVRITTKEAVDNFKEIVQESDGVIIARAYILVQSAIETVVQQELDMIREAHRQLKPVIVSSQVLESMISSTFPTFSEMGDIATLVNEDIDAIVLTGETAYGKYPGQALATLDRVCRFIEDNQIQKRVDRYSLTQKSIIPANKHIITNAITSATVDAAYRLKAKLIIVFTSTGSTALKISKLKPPSHIISVTQEKRVARLLQTVGGVWSLCFNTLLGSEMLIERILEHAEERKLVKKGDYIILLSGSIENLSGQINAIKIIVWQ